MYLAWTAAWTWAAMPVGWVSALTSMLSAPNFWLATMPGVSTAGWGSVSDTSVSPAGGVRRMTTDFQASAYEIYRVERMSHGSITSTKMVSSFSQRAS